jgi:ribonuclease Z
MHWTASVLSTISADSQPSLMINFDNAKYMVNAGENAVRAMCHSHTNRKRVQAVCLTRLTLERAGGLNGEYSSNLWSLSPAHNATGMLMTLSDANQIEDLTIVGPQGLLHRLACSRAYTYRCVCCLAIAKF